MSGTPPKVGSSSSTDEREPLLGFHPTSSYVNFRNDLEAVAQKPLSDLHAAGEHIRHDLETAAQKPLSDLHAASAHVHDLEAAAQKPLLELHAASEQVNTRRGLEAAVQTHQLEFEAVTQKTCLRWILCCLISAAFVGTVVLGVSKGFVNIPDDLKLQIQNALQSAIGGGLGGATATALQTLMFEPVRITMEHRQRHGVKTTEAIKALFAAGGLSHFYPNVFQTLVQDPASRFAGTATNTGMLTFLDSNPYTQRLPPMIKTAVAPSLTCMVTTVLTSISNFSAKVLQTEVEQARESLAKKTNEFEIPRPEFGAMATGARSFADHYLWSTMYNYIQAILPKQENQWMELGRQSLIGILTSAAAGIIAKPFQIADTLRNMRDREVGHLAAAREIVTKHGLVRLLFH